MILTTVGGWTMQRYLAIPNATLLGAIFGLIVARLIPTKSSCRVAMPKQD